MFACRGIEQPDRPNRTTWSWTGRERESLHPRAGRHPTASLILNGEAGTLTEEEPLISRPPIRRHNVIDFVYAAVPESGSSATVGIQRWRQGPRLFSSNAIRGGLSSGQRIRYTPTTCATPTNTPTATATVANTPTNTPTSTPTATATTTATGTPACTPNYTINTSAGQTVVPGTTMVAGSNCDDCANAVALPFPFVFYGTAFNSVNASSNGNLQLTSSSTAFENTCLPFAAMNNLIAAHFDDLLLTGAGQGIFTSTQRVRAQPYF